VILVITSVDCKASDEGIRVAHLGADRDLGVHLSTSGGNPNLERRFIFLVETSGATPEMQFLIEVIGFAFLGGIGGLIKSCSADR
jgi:hypothetical protein